MSDISEITKSKTDSIEKLVNTSNDGKQQMNKAMIAIEKIAESSSNVLKIIEVIVKCSRRN
jgi:methyl-accepting chemotaxis protein